jgi:hypothetical protein
MVREENINAVVRAAQKLRWYVEEEQKITRLLEDNQANISKAQKELNDSISESGISPAELALETARILDLPYGQPTGYE